MVKEEEYEGIEAFKCEICGMHYGNRDVAERCEEFCRENEGCSTKVAKRSLESSGYHPGNKEI
ncbi:MAG: hypothetical protein ABEK01_03275 [Candidatus Nanohaloarchaea archaeon]